MTSCDISHVKLHCIHPSRLSTAPAHIDAKNGFDKVRVVFGMLDYTLLLSTDVRMRGNGWMAIEVFGWLRAGSLWLQ